MHRAKREKEKSWGPQILKQETKGQRISIKISIKTGNRNKEIGYPKMEMSLLSETAEITQDEDWKNSKFKTSFVIILITLLRSN